MAPRETGAPVATPPGRLVRQPGAEPLPGYRLLEPLGKGGFGEVWKCEAPGGLFKAVKFVGGDPNAGGALAAQEREAIERIKRIRHPFLLSLERVEVLDGVLILVMELADRNLQSVLFDCQGQGLPGLPREQLLRFLREAAEALDVINFEHGLQHLDVKPHNLFVVSNHIKVADFGLVHRLPGVDTTSPGQRNGGATPLYASPETLQGSLSRHSDQYSLAIVYQQLLTGTVPFWSANPYHLLMLHISGSPDLSALPPADRPLVRRALAKVPEQRFSSCSEFVRALMALPDPGGEVVRRIPQPAPAPAASPPPAAVTRPMPAVLQPDQPTVVSPVAPASPSVLLAELAAPAPGPTPTAPGFVAPARPAAEESPLRLPQPSGLALPGYRLLACVGRTPLGCLWTVQDADGRERLAHCLLNLGDVAAERWTRLRDLRHPALPDRDVFRIPPGCVVLIADMGGTTLRDHFEQRRAEGLQGVPRPQLLHWLSAAAEALDDLNRVEKLPHLGVNPAHVLVDDDRVRLEDFGLLPLLWLPGGRPAAPLNPRYSAPELLAPVSSPTADQYSLALIYTEFLTGIYPRSKTHGGKSGPHRRPEKGSGLHRRPAAQGGCRVDLDFLPPADRPVVARALHDDPTQRYPTSTAFIQALLAATPAPIVSEDEIASLPPVAPFALLMGNVPARETPVPRPEQVAAEVVAAAAGRVAVCESENSRYIVHPDGAWECRFPIRLFASLLRPKLEGFRQQWEAREVSGAGDAFTFEIRTGGGKAGFWPRTRPRQPAGMHVLLYFQPPNVADTNQREAVARVALFGDHGPEQATLLPAKAPLIFQSLRAYLQGNVDQRTRERWPFRQRVGVYPVLSNLEIGKALEGQGCDVSLGGVRLLAPEEPPSEFVYLHFHETPAAAPLAVLGRIIRVLPIDEGAFELGVAFVMDGPPGA